MAQARASHRWECLYRGVEPPISNNNIPVYSHLAKVNDNATANKTGVDLNFRQVRDGSGTG